MTAPPITVITVAPNSSQSFAVVINCALIYRRMASISDVYLIQALPDWKHYKCTYCHMKEH